MQDSGSDDTALEYSKELYGNIIDWYKVAETKAQIVLTLDGIFTSFLIGSIITKRSDAEEILSAFDWETWTFLGLMVTNLALSIIASLLCLITRVMPRSEIERRYGQVLRSCPPNNYPPEVMWFFQTISRLNEQYYGEQALAVSSDVHKGALVNQIYLLSSRVLKKHIWINWAFAFTAVTLIFFIATGVSYVVRVASVG